LVTPIEQRLRRVPGLGRWLADRSGALATLPPAHGDAAPTGHVVLCGHGRTGRVIARVVRERGWPLVVVEQDRATAVRLRKEGVAAIHGDAANDLTLERTALQHARVLLLTLADPLATRHVVETARRIAPDVPI